ncbi:MAG: sigma-E factor negative regulatory protein [Pseudomonadales bacterium]|nr:sigma-E factor negative regulatory protein [Pseudomonadales bacterium]
MSEKAYESLSALMDNETDELETRRFLKQYSQQPELREELREKWIRYQQISTTLNGEKSAVLDLGLSKRIALDLDDEPVHHSSAGHNSGKTNRSRFLRPMGSVAIAASVTFLVVVGAQRFTVSDAGISSAPELASQSSSSTYQVDKGAATLRELANYNSGNGAVQLASVESNASGVPVTQSLQPSITDSQKGTWSISDKQADGLDVYLQQHARNAVSSGRGGIPFAQTASFKIDQ